MTHAYRLPLYVKPTRYDIEIEAKVEDPGFRGRVRIEVDVAQATPSVDLHARELDIQEAWAEAGGDRVRLETKVDPDTERVVLHAARAIPAGRAVLDLAFEGAISTGMRGLYLSRDGDQACLATQCEETEARAIFPCFDEPAFKARFGLTVRTSPGVTVLANAPLVAREERDGIATWRFEPTRVMSSYLFAMAVGRFAATPPVATRGIPMRVWAMEGSERFGDYGNDLAARLLPWFEDYFGAPYAFAKYDQLAVPSFSAGAMENPGLVLFRRTLLLRDPSTTSWQQEKLIARVIAHEFAHQWFGNLVTMAWWDDIWLNESFAEWMAHKAADAIAPDYHLWDDFHENKRDALVTDALETTHPIYTPVATPEEATELFDTVTYSKGSVLMRMIERFLGEDAFRAGLRTYMREFAEKNARGGDLWRHLEQASGKPVDGLATSWIMQPGFPRVRVRSHGDALLVEQRRFFGKPGVAPSPATWAIPLAIRFEDDDGIHETRHLLDAREATIPVPARGTIRWIHANADGVGFYRQHLDADLLARLARHVDRLSAAEQRDLLDDAWALARAGSQPIEAFLDLVGPVLRAARDHHVLGQAVSALDEIEEHVLDAGDERAVAAFRAWARELLAPEARRLGFAPRAAEPRDDAERRPHVLRGLALLARDADAQRAALALADAEAEDPTRVDPTLAGAAVQVAARIGDAARHAKHVAVYEARRAQGAPPQLAQRYLLSLGLFEDPALLARTLALRAEGRFPLEAVGPLLRMMLDERHAREAAWEHLKTHWGPLREGLGDMWTGFLVEHTGNLPARRRADVVHFLDANLGGVAQQAYARALETLDARAEFAQRIRAPLLAWLLARPT